MELGFVSAVLPDLELRTRALRQSRAFLPQYVG
jgi:hypothetical protein